VNITVVLYNRAMSRLQSASLSSMTKTRILLLIAVLLLLYIIVPRIGSFSDSFTALQDAYPGYVLAAVLLTVLTYFLAATIYWILTARRIRYRSTLAVQAASAFTNRVLPAGLGTLTLYVQYLKKTGLRLPHAIAIVSVNNIVGLIGHLIILVLALLLTSQAYPANIALPNKTLFIAAVIALLGVTLVLLLFDRLRQRLAKATKSIAAQVLVYRKRPQLLLSALLCSCGLTVTYAAIFFCCVAAVGIHFSIGQIFLVFTVGLIAASATPTPGGLIGAEAGLTAGLVAYGAATDQALAAALLYRFLTYWLPLVPGFIVFVRVRHLYS
jgi:glycosyltransferase 2 family protein